MHILVTGCAGFIGSHLCDHLLKEGHRITGIDSFDPFYPVAQKRNNLRLAESNEKFLLMDGSITDKNFLDTLPSDIEVVIHLAAKAGVRPSVEDPHAYIVNNITGTHLLLQWMQKNGLRKLIFASSSSVYGNNAKIPFAESDPVDHPISPYAFTKKAGELMTHTYHHLYDIDTLNLRFFTVYGPRQRPDLAIRKFVELILADREITLYGDGSSSRDYTYVGDVVNAISAALSYVSTHENCYETINIGNSKPVTLTTLVENIYGILDKEPKIRKTSMQVGDVLRTYADTNKAKSMLDFEAETSLEDGLISFVDWFRNR